MGYKSYLKNGNGFDINISVSSASASGSVIGGGGLGGAGGGAPMGGFCGAFNAANLKALTDRTGYTLLQQNGQRKYVFITVLKTLR